MASASMGGERLIPSLEDYNARLSKLLSKSPLECGQEMKQIKVGLRYHRIHNNRDFTLISAAHLIEA